MVDTGEAPPKIRDDEEGNAEDMTMGRVCGNAGGGRMTGRKPGKVALHSVWLAEWKRNRKLGSDASVEFLTPKYKSVKKAVCEGGGNWGEGDWVFGLHFYFLLKTAKRGRARDGRLSLPSYFSYLRASWLGLIFRRCCSWASTTDRHCGLGLVQ